METVLQLKFSQHESLKQELIQTLDAELIEVGLTTLSFLSYDPSDRDLASKDSDKDSFWGVGRDRKGQNELGKALMRLRAVYLEEVKKSSSGALIEL
jgi:predicted NAD-dependent protein-ADP-ribosyltransferase YbiA (DUF1768 family)